MGNKQANASSVKEKEEIGNILNNQLVLCKNSFDFNYVIGKGGFGKVSVAFYIFTTLGLESFS